VDEDVKMFLALNGALLDGSIACWDACAAPCPTMSPS